jgi:hypothetical protein
MVVTTMRPPRPAALAIDIRREMLYPVAFKHRPVARYPMFPPASRRRAVAALVTVSLFFLLAVRSFPLAARDGAEEARAAVGAPEPSPGFVEQQAGGTGARKQGSRLLPTLLGLAVAGAVVAVLVATVFRQTGYNPHIIPLEFIEGVSHSFFPLIPGRTMEYAVAVGGEAVSLTVTDTAHTKLILGILCLGVQDRVSTPEWLLEDTWRWYAQDMKGDVWYFARETKKYDREVVTESWSWQAGVDGAKPGRIMPGKPQDFLNKEFWQAYAPGKAEEKAQILSVNETVAVPFGSFSGCVKVKAYSDLDPGALEYRYYAPGVGLILCEEGATGSRRIQLVGINNGSPAGPADR